MSVSFHAVPPEGGRPFVPPAGPGRPLWAEYGLNWANANARAVLDLLGLLRPGGELYGDATIPECRRAVMQARARFERRAPAHVRAAQQDGRIFVTGLDLDGLAERVEAFAAFVEAAAECGAVGLSWG